MTPPSSPSHSQPLPPSHSQPLPPSHSQVLLLSAQRDASGLTLTAASHVIIVEPQPDVATEQQMIGRVHRIGQTRQTHVHRIVVEGTFEPHLAKARLGERASIQADAPVEMEEDEE